MKKIYNYTFQLVCIYILVLSLFSVSNIELTIDNYDDSIEYADEQKSVMIETTSRQMIFDWAKDNGIILKRYKEDGY